MFFYYSNKTPSAVRYKNWKMYFGMVGQSPSGFITGVVPYDWTQVVNIKRDPFKTSMVSKPRRCSVSAGPLVGRSLPTSTMEHAADRPGAVAEE